MKLEKITLEWLKKHHASKRHIRFFEINRLEGFPVCLIDEIKGDYGNFIEWINDTIFAINNCEYKYDDKGYKIYGKNRNGYECRYEYNEHGNVILEIDDELNEYRYDEYENLIYEKNNKGYIYEWKYEYDEHGNAILKRDKNGKEWKYQYDEHGNLICVKFEECYECRWKYEYDEVGNIITEIDCVGNIHTYEVEYYSDGQLKRYDSYDSIELPWFEKN